MKKLLLTVGCLAVVSSGCAPPRPPKDDGSTGNRADAVDDSGAPAFDLPALPLDPIPYLVAPLPGSVFAPVEREEMGVRVVSFRWRDGASTATVELCQGALDDRGDCRGWLSPPFDAMNRQISLAFRVGGSWYWRVRPAPREREGAPDAGSVGASVAPTPWWDLWLVGGPTEVSGARVTVATNNQTPARSVRRRQNFDDRDGEDLVAVNSDGTQIEVWLNGVSPVRFPPPGALGRFSDPARSPMVWLFPDLNGDRRADVVIVTTVGSNRSQLWWVAGSTDTSVAPRPRPIALPSEVTSIADVASVGDINTDGLADLAVSTTGDGGARLFFLSSAGNTLAAYNSDERWGRPVCGDPQPRGVDLRVMRGSGDALNRVLVLCRNDEGMVARVEMHNFASIEVPDAGSIEMHRPATPPFAMSGGLIDVRVLGDVTGDAIDDLLLLAPGGAWTLVGAVGTDWLSAAPTAHFANFCTAPDSLPVTVTGYLDDDPRADLVIASRPSCISRSGDSLDQWHFSAWLGRPNGALFKLRELTHAGPGGALLSPQRERPRLAWRDLRGDGGLLLFVGAAANARVVDLASREVVASVTGPRRGGPDTEMPAQRPGNPEPQYLQSDPTQLHERQVSDSVEE